MVAVVVVVAMMYLVLGTSRVCQIMVKEPSCNGRHLMLPVDFCPF